jgi:ferredoxin
VGITPLMSMLRWVVDSGAPANVILFYSVRRPQDLVYGRELESIVALHDNIRVVVSVTGDVRGSHGWMGLRQRLNGSLIANSAPDFREREVFLCGPTVFADAVRSELEQAGLPAGQFHMEKFGGAKKQAPSAAVHAQVAVSPGGASATPATVAPRRPTARSQPAPAPAPAPAPVPVPAAHPVSATAGVAPAVIPVPPPVPAAVVPPGATSGHQVHFTISNVRCVSEPDATLLDLAEENDMDHPYSCREGSCGTCRVKCLQGTVIMEDNELSPDEIRDGWIYACVATATSDVQIDA